MEDHKQEDLDMLTLANSIKKLLADFFNAIGDQISLLVNNAARVLLFITVAVLLCLGLYFLQKPSFSSQLLISHNRVNNDFCYEMVENLSSLIDARNENRLLAHTLKMDPALAKEIHSISYKPLNEQVAAKYADSANVLLPFRVEVEVSDITLLDTLGGALLAYFESNDFATRHKAIDREQLLQTLLRIEREIMEIDSLKKIVNSGIIPRASGNGIIMGEPIDPISVYRRGMDLHEKKLATEKKLLLNNSFESVVNLSTGARRSSHGKLFYIAVGILLGTVSGWIYLRARKARN